MVARVRDGGIIMVAHVLHQGKQCGSATAVD